MFTNVKRFSAIMLLTAAFIVGSLSAQTLPTPAERTNFQSGPTMYDDLMEYVYDLESKSELMQVQKVTETLLGRDVVLCILSNPPVYKPADVINTGKPIVLIVNNVHGGEVAGKEASLILMRDLLFGDLKPLLDDVVVLNIPTINPDGAERRNRTNAQGFDMNRDYIKLESQEINALVTKVINTWQPDIHLDTHHGGSAPYTLTYQTNMNPAGDKELMKLGNEVILPRVRKALRAEDYDGFWYSGTQTRNGLAGWGPTSVEPRKQHVYSTLANMVGFLYETPRGTHRVINNGTKVVEIPSEERYKHQVRGEYIGQRELIRFASDEGELLRSTVVEAKKRATMLGANDSDNDQIPLEYEQTAKFETEFWRRKGSGQRFNRAEMTQEQIEQMRNAPVEYELVKGPVFTKFEPTRTTTRPWGYILPPKLAHVVPLLLDQGITVKRLTEPAQIEVEAYTPTEVTHTTYFQGHYLVSYTVTKSTETVDFPKGSLFIPTGQPRSNLICYILEPETNDNIGTWGHLDNYIQLRSTPTEEELQQRQARAGAGQRGGRGGRTSVIPIYRLMKKTNLKGTLVKAFDEKDRRRYIR